MRISMCPLLRYRWAHATLPRPAVLLADHIAITYLQSSGLAELIDLMKVARGLEQVKAFAVDIPTLRSARTNQSRSRPMTPSKTSHGTLRPHAIICACSHSLPPKMICNSTHQALDPSQGLSQHTRGARCGPAVRLQRGANVMGWCRTQRFSGAVFGGFDFFLINSAIKLVGPPRSPPNGFMGSGIHLQIQEQISG